MTDLIQSNRDALLSLTGIQMNENHAYAHLVNTCIYAMSLASSLKFDKPRIAALGTAAILHDLGKVLVSPEIISNPEDLTDDEQEALHRHPIEAALIFSEVTGITKMAMVAAFEHHQHGGIYGYPKKDDSVLPHLFSQIISLADTYEVLTATRVYYHVPMPPEEVVRILMKKRNTDFKPVLVKAFLRMVGIFPIGTLLKLSSGEVGLVTQQTADLLRPRILLLTKFDGSEKESGEEVSLLEKAGDRYLRDVIGTIHPDGVKIDSKLYFG